MIPHKGDLISNVYLQVKLPALIEEQKYQNNLAYKFVMNVQLKIDNKKVQEYSDNYLYVHNEISESKTHSNGLDEMLGRHSTNSFDILSNKEQSLFIPIPIWNNDKLQQFFPIGSLKKQELVMTVEFADGKTLYRKHDSNSQNVSPTLRVRNNGNVGVTLKVETDELTDSENKPARISDALLLVDYIMLDTVEKNMITQKQEYLYNTVLSHKERIKSDSFTIELPFNLPVKQLIWVIHDFEYLSNMTEFTDSEQIYYENFVTYPMTTARLLMGQIDNELTESLGGEYFRHIQGYYRNKRMADFNKYIYSFSFALSQDDGHPNGSVHFGKLANKSIQIKADGVKNKYITVYARCYNVLKSENGFGTILLQP